MTDVLTTFDFGDNEVRVVLDGRGEPWWVAKDVAEALGYVWNGMARVAHVPKEWRGVTSVGTTSGAQEMVTLSEQGLYFFLGRSDKPKAFPMQKWVAGVVLPSIRKTGSYSVVPSFPMPRTFAEALRLAADQQERLEEQAKELESARPAVAFLDKYVEAKSTQALRTVAKVLGVKEREFIAWLLDGGVLFRQSGRLMPTAEYQHSGFFEVKTGEANGHAFAQTRFTPGGVSWIAARWTQRKTLAPVNAAAHPLL